MNITTKYTTTANGAGRIVAKANGRQLTSAYDQSKSANWNHGTAAGALILEKGSDIMSVATVSDIVARLDAGKVTHMGFDDGTHRFVF